MNAPFARDLLGWRQTQRGRLVPNTADSSSDVSERIAASILDILGVARGIESGVADPTSGRPLENAVAADLASSLASADPGRALSVHGEPRVVTEFIQYEHLRRVEQMARDSPELRLVLGTDYVIRPDVVVALPGRAGELPFLHAVISCKWTIRSDRVQNIRHEYNQLVRHRRERLPHLIVVTAEPLPSRLSSIVRGTGEVDATYHIAFEAMAEAMSDLSLLGRVTREQTAAWEEAVDQGRLRPYSELATTLARW